MNRRKCRRCVAALFLAGSLTVATGVRAQTRSTVTGTVADAAGVRLTRATVTIESRGLKGDTRTATTNSLGRYQFSGLRPGDYDLTASWQGLQTVRRTHVRVSLEATLTIDFVLTPSSAPDMVIVGGEQSVIDVASTTSMIRLTAEDLVNLPVDGGDGILQMVPGVTPVTAFGSGSDTAQLVVDGAPITIAEQNRARSAAIHAYWMEEAVIGPGATADAGDFGGGVANVALRSGSNRFSGLFEHLIAPSGWVGDNTGSLQEPLRTRFVPQKILSRWSSNAQAGGPIVPERLFYFSGLAYAKNKTVQAGTLGNVPYEETSPAMLTRLTWSQSPAFRVDGFVEADEARERGTLGRNALPETANDRRWRVGTGQARVDWTVNPHTLLEFQVAGARLDFRGIPAARRSGPAPRRDLVTGIRSGNVQSFQDQSVNRDLSRVTLTWFSRGGHGTLRSGLEFERTRYGRFNGIPAGRAFTDAAGVPETVVLWAGDWARGTATRATVFVQDSWTPLDRLTIHTGGRLSLNRGSVPDRGSVFRTTAFSPRIGMAWDVSRDHKTVVRASFGRLYEGLHPAVFDFMDTSGRTPRITARVVGPDIFEETTRTTLTEGNVAVDDQLAHAYVDQFVVGIEREVLGDGSLVLQYVRRNFGDIWALIDTGSQYVSVERPDPGPDGRLGTADDGARLMVFDLVNAGESFTVLTNPADAFRRYAAFQAIAQKRFSRNSQLLGAYTWSSASGTVNAGGGENRASGASTASLTAGGAAGSFFNPNRRIRADGPLSFDYRHQLNVQAVYVVPSWEGVAISAAYRFLSGGAAGRTASITGLQPDAQTVRLEPRGTRRIDGGSMLDVRIEKSFSLGRPGRTMGIHADLLNITNQGVPLALTVFELSGDTFGEPTTWADPRAVRIAARLRW